MGTLVNPAKIPLAPTESCDMATKSFLEAACTPRHGVVTQQNATAATCLIEAVNGASWQTDISSCFCDGTNKFNHYNTTVISMAPYGANVDCALGVSQWKDGQEIAHPGSCDQ